MLLAANGAFPFITVGLYANNPTEQVISRNNVRSFLDIEMNLFEIEKVIFLRNVKFNKSLFEPKAVTL